MEAVSDRFKLALTSDQVRTVRVEVLIGGDETHRQDLSDYFTDGSLDVSRQAIRRSGTLTFADNDSGLIVPTSPDALLAPYGNQLRVWAGLQFPDGTEELVPVITGRITKSTSKKDVCTVDISDRAWIVANAKLTGPWQVAAGSLWENAIADLLQDRYPGVPADIPPVTVSVTPRLSLDEQADPWAALQGWAQSIGYALYFTPLGVATLAGETELAVRDPVWTYDGTPTASLPYDESDWHNLALYDEAVTWDADGAYNAVIITGESSSLAAPVRGEAHDDDPASPTRWGGPFGYKPLTESSELPTSNEQALVMAQGRLQQVNGAAESLQIPALCNPALDVADLVRVIRPELGQDTVHALDQFGVPLRGGTQTLATRVRRVVVQG